MTVFPLVEIGGLKPYNINISYYKGYEVMERVKFYSKGDWASGYHLKKVEQILMTFNENSDFDINDILEMHNIILYIENDLKLETWTQEQIESYRTQCKSIKNIIGRYFGNLTNENIIENYLRLEYDYRNDFWFLFEKYKLFNKISAAVFTQMLDLNEVLIQDVLECKNTVKTYGKQLRDKLVSNPSTATIILNHLEIKSLSKQKTIFFPKELTNEDKEKIICNYIDSKNAHPNVLKIIENLRDSDQLRISDKTRLKAKRRNEKETETFFTENSGMKIGTAIKFVKNQTNAVETSKENDLHIFSYSSDWIQENLDFPTIMNNFIYLFEFVDRQIRLLCVSKECDLGIFERSIFITSKYDYPTGIAFNFKQQIIYLQMTAYYQMLSQNNIRLEDVFEWFFTSYLSFEFQIDGFKIQMPSIGSTFLEKCRTIFPEIESVLKQYKILVQEGNIDLELLQISSSSSKYGDIPSLLQKKYVYGHGENFNLIKFCLSSDQCLLSYIKRIGEKYDTFYELISNEQVWINDYNDSDRKNILWLQEQKIIHLTQDGLIEWTDKNKIQILFDLCKNDVISFWHYPMEVRHVFDELYEQNLIVFENTLLSRPESNYIDFLLNKSKYVNGYDIRNSYEHGTQPDEHERFYMWALIVATICIIKINEDVCIWNDIQKFGDYDEYKPIKDYYESKGQTN